MFDIVYNINECSHDGNGYGDGMFYAYGKEVSGDGFGDGDTLWMQEHDRGDGSGPTEPYDFSGGDGNGIGE